MSMQRLCVSFKSIDAKLTEEIAFKNFSKNGKKLIKNIYMNKIHWNSGKMIRPIMHITYIEIMNLWPLFLKGLILPLRRLEVLLEALLKVLLSRTLLLEVLLELLSKATFAFKVKATASSRNTANVATLLHVAVLFGIQSKKISVFRRWCVIFNYF